MREGAARCSESKWINVLPNCALKGEGNGSSQNSPEVKWKLYVTINKMNTFFELSQYLVRNIPQQKTY